MNIGIFGLGEAGSLIATDLAAAGVEILAYDPADVATPSGVIRVNKPVEVRGERRHLADISRAQTQIAVAVLVECHLDLRGLAAFLGDRQLVDDFP